MRIRYNRYMGALAGLLLAALLTLDAMAGVSDLPGKVVAIWSKGAEKFVRSPGVDDGVLRADRKSYENNDEGRFLCFAEAGGTLAFMDTMLNHYLTHTNGKLASAVSGAAATRRFTLVNQGNHYYAIQAENGKYVRVDGAGELVVDAVTVTDDSLFAIVPIRTGPNVVMRAYEGWEADFHSANPADFPVNKVNVGMLQMTPDLYTDTQFTDMRAVWNTDQYETEFILPYSTTANLTNQVDRLVDRIKRLEGLRYSFDYVILYHEILADLPGGPWSDPRICSQEEIDLFRERVTVAYNAGEVNNPSYRVFCLPYQFNISLMGFGSYANTPVGCDAATLEFIKNNFDGMILEVNGHDYTQRDEDSDAVDAAVWCRDNGLEFGITSGGGGKDANYKTMYGNIFAAMDAAGFDKSWDGMHYILHHVHQPVSDRLPEWVENTTTENASWLIEQVMPEEAPSISATLDTDGDGIPDLQEALDGTFPLDPHLDPRMAFDDFSTYTDGPINGQTGGAIGFSGAWAGSGTVANGVVSLGENDFRCYRSFDPAPIASSGTIYIRVNAAIGTGTGFQALELAPTANSDVDTVRLVGGANLRLEVRGGTGGGLIAANDGLSHEWLIELNLDAQTGKVWLDPTAQGFDPTAGGTAFTPASGFQFNAINLASFADASIALDDITVGPTWESVGFENQSPMFAAASTVIDGQPRAITFDWTAGSTDLQGWVNVLEDTTGGTAGQPLDNPYNFQGSGVQLQQPGGSQITYPHKTCVVQSPMFQINESGVQRIEFSLIGGTGSGTLVSEFASLPTASSPDGFAGMALMRVSDGAYLLFENRSATGIASQEFVWDTATLNAAIAGDDPSETYRLQLIDYDDASWGYVACGYAVLDTRVIAGQTLSFMVAATDPDLPPQNLTFSLLNPPAGAGIDSGSGLFSWRPAITQSPSSNVISVVVTDDGIPNLSATQTFWVVVNQPAQLGMENGGVTAVGVSNGLFGFTLTGDSGPDYSVDVSTNLIDWTSIWITNSPQLPLVFSDPASTNYPQRFYRIMLGP